ncbi:winged helix-turn-helix domain-containing protein [Streptomyces sp. M2CJ-2]|uniref:AfsR/SARP family transcriptional regulator n=1 Tax=Streptomyces sp. M2CJ-2 TaxID=2803948 RepID=UPI0019270387|nr:BTAD domain-containing putative transcriptional regulator [Streptomyces sp. M2CJ-2]MBL3671000.1 winged helix-turn-helix domain-containing protein [Streptomyces sp. M2CJ-2]
MQLRVLGPLECWVGSERLHLGGAAPRRVLATLLLEAGHVVSVSRLVDAVWADAPPTAEHQVRKAVAELRRRIPQGARFVLTEPPGYRIVADRHSLDLAEFTWLLGEADRHTATGDREAARRALESALALWRGPVLGEAAGQVIANAAASLEERRLAALEKLTDLRLAAGESGALVADLRGLVDRHPLREPLRAQLMLALYRDGRPAEALAEYRAGRELLVEELGIDPGPRLSSLYESILREDPALLPPVHETADLHGVTPGGEDTAPVRSAAPPAGRSAPCTIPYDLADFTGRRAELDAMLGPLSCASSSADGSCRIVAIDGMGGAGKTSLAIRAARTVADIHPDGQLHVDLRGFTPDEPPLTPAVALETLLRDLGTPTERIPDDLDSRTALWRSSTAGLRLLLLLDNAADAAQVRPLLPTSTGCSVLITSRARLVDLDGAAWLSLEPLPHSDGRLLLEEILGGARRTAEPEASDELVRLCGRLPLALRIVGARLRNRPRWTLRYMADRLCDEGRLLEELSAGERGVAATVRMSYQAMDEEHRTAFRLLALHPGVDIDAHAAAALLGTGLWHAEQLLERLLDVHLLQQPDMGLYRFHDLVRTFARQLRGTDTRGADGAAVGRLLDYYLTATETACTLLFPGRRTWPSGTSPYGGPLPALADPGTAARWFDREHSSLLSAVHLADRSDLERHTVGLTRNLVFRLNTLGHFEEFRDLSRIAVAAARRADDLPALSVSLSNLSVACWKLGRIDEGIEAATEGKDVAVALGDLHTEAHSESTLGLLRTVLGQHTSALPHLDRALVLERELKALRAQVETLTNLSTLYAQWGRYAEAASSARQSLLLNQDLGYRDNEVMALIDLSFAQMGLGEFDAALARLEQATALCDRTSPPGDAALALALAAEASVLLGRRPEAADLADRAEALTVTSGSLTRQARIENVVGRVRRQLGSNEQALRLHRQVYEIASAMRYRAEEAHALCGMAKAVQGLGDASAAARYWDAADEVFELMDTQAHGSGCCLTA